MNFRELKSELEDMGFEYKGPTNNGHERFRDMGGEGFIVPHGITGGRRVANYMAQARRRVRMYERSKIERDVEHGVVERDDSKLQWYDFDDHEEWQPSSSMQRLTGVDVKRMSDSVLHDRVIHGCWRFERREITDEDREQIDVGMSNYLYRAFIVDEGGMDGVEAVEAVEDAYTQLLSEGSSIAVVGGGDSAFCRLGDRDVVEVGGPRDVTACESVVTAFFGREEVAEQWEYSSDRDAAALLLMSDLMSSPLVDGGALEAAESLLDEASEELRVTRDQLARVNVRVEELETELAHVHRVKGGTIGGLKKHSNAKTKQIEELEAEIERLNGEIEVLEHKYSALSSSEKGANWIAPDILDELSVTVFSRSKNPSEKWEDADDLAIKAIGNIQRLRKSNSEMSSKYGHEKKRKEELVALLEERPREHRSQKVAEDVLSELKGIIGRQGYGRPDSATETCKAAYRCIQDLRDGLLSDGAAPAASKETDEGDYKGTVSGDVLLQLGDMLFGPEAEWPDDEGIAQKAVESLHGMREALERHEAVHDDYKAENDKLNSEVETLKALNRSYKERLAGAPAVGELKEYRRLAKAIVLAKVKGGVGITEAVEALAEHVLGE